uniref:Uncharacterized protein n=1 Tax=Anguilla anguilla TaxID=7936 RepID=A0A0E9X2H9_ANGAN
MLFKNKKNIGKVTDSSLVLIPRLLEYNVVASITYYLNPLAKPRLGYRFKHKYLYVKYIFSAKKKDTRVSYWTLYRNEIHIQNNPEQT